MPVIATAAAAVSGIVSTVAGIGDAKKRRALENNLAMLTQDQKNALERELLKTNDNTRRLEILYNAVAGIRQAQTSTILQATITSREMSKVQQQRTLAFVILGGAVAILIAVVLIRKNRN